MNKVVFFSGIISFYILTNIVLSQPIGNTWYYSYESTNSNGYIKLIHVKDTIVESKSFNVLEKIKITYSWPGYYDTTYINNEYLLWEKDSVYRIVDNKITLLFRFNSNIGDTIIFYKKNPIVQNCDSIGKGIVDGVGVEFINGYDRKWFSVKPLQDTKVGLRGKIINGIGPVEDYFFPEYISCVTDANEGGVFRCISDNLQTVYSNSIDACDYITSTQNIEKDKILIYPNPFCVLVLIH